MFGISVWDTFLPSHVSLLVLRHERSLRTKTNANYRSLFPITLYPTRHLYHSGLQILILRLVLIVRAIHIWPMSRHTSRFPRDHSITHPWWSPLLHTVCNVSMRKSDSVFTSYLDISGTHYDPVSLNHPLNLARADVQQNSGYLQRINAKIRLKCRPRKASR